MDYLLFLLLNAVLFIRPAEIVPELLDLAIYEVVIIACLIVALPKLLEQLRLRSIVENPISACVIGVFFALVLSHLAYFRTWEARMLGAEFGKVVLYYLLLVGVLRSGPQLRTFLWSLAGFALVLTSLALLQFHEVLQIPGLETIQQKDYDKETGEMFIVPRLVSTGIFNDPNDLCLLLVSAMAICIYGLGERRFGLLRGLWLAPLGLFGYALSLTQSRGGFLALLAAALVLCRARFGWWKTIPLAAVALPLMFMIFSGRQTDISASEGTGQARVQLWSEGLTLFREAPFFGIGQGEYVEEVGGVAHNSFIHAYTELGFFGGTFFLGAFFFALWTLYRLGSARMQILDPDMQRLRPYLLAIVAGYAAGMLTLSRTYIVPTYMVLGLVTVYLRVTPVYPPLPSLRFDFALAGRLAFVSVAFLLVTYVYVRTFAVFG